MKRKVKQQKGDIGSIDSDARYDSVVKFTNGGFKLTIIELAVDSENTQGQDNDEGDADPPPAKKAMKAAAVKN